MARSSWLTRSYNFIDKDPECDVFRTLYQKQRIKESDLAVLAGLSVSTVKKLFGGETRSPRHSTFGKLAGAMGQEYGLRPIREVDYAKEVPIAREEFKAHKERLKRARERAAKKNGGRK
jgi:transcriptional regulator with XRE-family HTH domain